MSSTHLVVQFLIEEVSTVGGLSLVSNSTECGPTRVKGMGVAALYPRSFASAAHWLMLDVVNGGWLRKVDGVNSTASAPPRSAFTTPQVIPSVA